VSDFIARRLLFRFLSSVPVLPIKESVSPKSISVASDARLLVLAPHPDDESIGCGGLLAHYSAQCEVVCLTDGSRGDPTVSVHQLIETRESELAAAMAVAGVRNFRYIGIPDRSLTESYQRFSSLSIASIDIIFIPNFLDQHPDHKAVTWLLQRLLREKEHKPSLQIAFYEVWATLPVWNAYVDLDDHLRDKKKKIIDCFISQTKHIDYAQRIDALNIYRGIAVAKPAVEAYLLISAEDFLNIA
jgi:LmbE family N-acetylglucosaminyl deacetylase